MIKLFWFLPILRSRGVGSLFPGCLCPQHFPAWTTGIPLQLPCFAPGRPFCGLGCPHTCSRGFAEAKSQRRRGSQGTGGARAEPGVDLQRRPKPRGQLSAGVTLGTGRIVLDGFCSSVFGSFVLLTPFSAESARILPGNQRAPCGEAFPSASPFVGGLCACPTPAFLTHPGAPRCSLAPAFVPHLVFPRGHLENTTNPSGTKRSIASVGRSSAGGDQGVPDLPSAPTTTGSTSVRLL